MNGRGSVVIILAFLIAIAVSPRPVARKLVPTSHGTERHWMHHRRDTRDGGNAVNALSSPVRFVTGIMATMCSTYQAYRDTLRIWKTTVDWYLGSTSGLSERPGSSRLSMALFPKLMPYRIFQYGMEVTIGAGR